jgi:hypothetical protein
MAVTHFNLIIGKLACPGGANQALFSVKAYVEALILFEFGGFIGEWKQTGGDA